MTTRGWTVHAHRRTTPQGRRTMTSSGPAVSRRGLLALLGVVGASGCSCNSSDAGRPDDRYITAIKAAPMFTWAPPGSSIRDVAYSPMMTSQPMPSQTSDVIATSTSVTQRLSRGSFSARGTTASRTATRRMDTTTWARSSSGWTSVSPTTTSASICTSRHRPVKLPDRDGGHVTSAATPCSRGALTG